MRAELIVDLESVAENWRTLDSFSGADVETAAVVKANAYGLGCCEIAHALRMAGARSFFVAILEEGIELRESLDSHVSIYVLSGHMKGEAKAFSQYSLSPVLNSIEQYERHLESASRLPFAIQIDSGMNRLGMEIDEFQSVRASAIEAGVEFVMSHLACSDEPGHWQNREQLEVFGAATAGLGVRRSLAATGGTFLGRTYHFDMCRPGIGLYGGLPYKNALPVVNLNLPVIQVRDVQESECVGYGATWQASQRSRIATVSSGYSDGILRSLGGNCVLYADGVPCSLAGRVSMDLLTVDVTHLAEIPELFQLLGPDQTINDLADHASTICNEILTSLGSRYNRTYINGRNVNQ